MEKEAETKRKLALIEAEKVAAVERVELERYLAQKQNEQTVSMSAVRRFSCFSIFFFTPPPRESLPAPPPPPLVPPPPDAPPGLLSRRPEESRPGLASR